MWPATRPPLCAALPGLVIMTRAPANHSSPQPRARPGPTWPGLLQTGAQPFIFIRTGPSWLGRAGHRPSTLHTAQFCLTRSSVSAARSQSVFTSSTRSCRQSPGPGGSSWSRPASRSWVSWLWRQRSCVPPAPADWAGAGTGRYQHSAPAQLSRKIEIPTKITIRATFALIRLVTGCTEHSRKCVTGQIPHSLSSYGKFYQQNSNLWKHLPVIPGASRCGVRRVEIRDCWAARDVTASLGTTEPVRAKTRRHR